MVSLILFDCDGTLVDSQHVIVETMNRAFRAEGLAPPEPGKTKAIVGLSLEVAMGKLVPDRDAAMHRRLAEAYKEAFTKLRLDGDFTEPLYEGALVVLDKLSTSDILLGVATGKSLRGLRMVLEHHKIRERFVTLQTADFHPSKPHPAMVETALRETGTVAEATWLIGDTSFDMEMAVAAGVRPIGVDWGYHPTEDLRRAGAEVVLDRFEQLLDLVEHDLGTSAFA
ncbi:MAG: HAD-IA family hydrolase [Geminicoccaceae bacterium]